MPLRRCIAETSHREYLTWMVWLNEEWNNPNRTDHYLMQIAQLLSDSKKVQGLNDLKIPFTLKKQQQQQTREQQLRIEGMQAKTAFKVAVGLTRKKKNGI